MKSKQWLNRQKNDYYVKKAKQMGYLSRSAFKLFEINDKFHLIDDCKNIFEFGSSPGGWSQVILEINPKTKITSIDILDLKFNHPNITFFKQNFEKFDYNKISNIYNLVLSDIAPNAIGHKSTDHLRIANQIDIIIKVLPKLLKKNGSLIVKIWKGAQEKFIIYRLKLLFNKVLYFKPNSSRKDSSEIFIVALKYKE